MTAQPGRYVSLFPSEQMVPKPWIGCGVSTDIIVTGYGTLGESQTKANGRPYGRDDLTHDLQVGLRAFHAKPDSNGIPDRGDADRIHSAMFPNLPDLIPLVDRDFDEVVEALRDDAYAVSIATFLPAMPAGLAITRYTRAPHQMPLVGVRNGRTTVQDPMHPPQVGWAGHQVPLQQVEKAAKSFPGAEHGLVMAWKVPIGGWTQGTLAIRALRGELREVKIETAAKEARIKGLKADLAECQSGQPTPPGDCSDKIASALEEERIIIRDMVDDRRSI
jgi:hypothetical protein